MTTTLSNGAAGEAPTVGTDTPTEGETRYELVGDLDLNNPEPAAEVRNETADSGGPLLVEAGIETGIETAVGADEVLLDAYFGSYPDAVQEVIIGTDDRIRVLTTTGYPWRAICALKITAATGARFIGTGWLISPRTVVTAGHCVYLHDHGGWARSIEVIPGANDAARPYGSFTGTALRSVSGWTASKNREFDYGAIILPQNARPGATTGTFGFSVRDDAFLRAAALNLSGYPSDKGGNQQWFMAQRPKALSSRVITYDIDTIGGQSGSPVWVLVDGQRYAVGVHTNGSSAGNSATRIVNDVFQNLSNWKNQGA